MIKSADSLGMALLESASRHSEHTALLHKANDQYQPITYRELGEKVISLAGTLIQLGLKPGDLVGIISHNRPEWAIVDFAVLCCGGVIVPVYASLSATETQYILKDAGVSYLFAENEVLANKAKLLLQEELLKRIWTFKTSAEKSHGFGAFSELLPNTPLNGVLTRNEVESHLAQVKRSDLATIIYTSGTTGKPKGVMLTHGNLLSNLEQILGALDINENDIMLSLIPLAHVFERTCGHFLLLCVGGTVAYVESLAKATDNLRETKPTVMIAVPRFFETMKAKIEAAVRQSSPLKRAIFQWGLRVSQKQLNNPEGSHNLFGRISYTIADRLVLKKIRQITGGRIRFFVSGGAALPRAVSDFFLGAGILLLEGYGMTEASPVISVNRPDNNQPGTIGSPLLGIEVKITGDQEILVRGANIMQGYYNLPEETQAIIQVDGFLRTGDLGRWDEAGRLIITGRKKDLIVTSGGRNIATTAIENKIKSSPYIAEVILIGDGKQYLTALIVPDFEQLQIAGYGDGEAVKGMKTLADDVKVIKLIENEIVQASKELASYERVMKFSLLPRPLSLEEGEMTPSLKVRRKVVLEKYAGVIEGMYGN